MSETNWHNIQRKLEGRCYMCGGELPKHIGVCPVYGEEMIKKYKDIEEGINEVDDAALALLKKYNYV